MSAVRKTREITGVAPDKIPYRDLLDLQEPVILKAVLKEWPLVREGERSAADAASYLKRFYAGSPVTIFTAPAETGGRFFYTQDMSGRNFEAANGKLDDFLDRVIKSAGDTEAPALYVGSTDLDRFLPGLRGENDLLLTDPMFEKGKTFASIWLGNRTTAATHYDMSNNMACCMVGRRRFTLFPPEQVANLYPGPLERTPGGQVVSMVDLNNPDFDKFPKFATALENAEVADIEPGDLLFYPALWWHNVEAFSDFNVMINYWWNDVPTYLDNPMDTMMHGMLSLRDRPEAEKKAWQSLFDYYVFGPADQAGAHLPDSVKGALAPIDEMQARRMRMFLLQRLNR